MGGHLGKMRHSGRVRTLAFVLLASVLALTLTPVCGSPLDVDAGKCCEHRACHMACDHVTKAPGQANAQDDCCSPHAKNSSAPGDADQCCEHGRLIYPTIKPQSSGSATILLPLAPAIVLASSRPANTFVEHVIWGIPLNIPLRPLYILTATYRI